jgi:hypothetical protein
MATTDAKAARERKQKIFVAVGGLVLLLLLAIQLPKLLGGSSETAATTTTATDTVTVGGTTPEVVPTGVPVSLHDTDRPLAPAPGKLPSLGVFTSKDPFVQKVKTPTAAATPESTPPAAPEGKKPSEPSRGEATNKEKPAPEPPSEGFSVGEAAAAVTVISVNGARQVLVPGRAFPSTNPVFVLLAEQPRTKTVRIGIAGGALANGAEATKLKVGKPLVLVNTATKARYKLVLVSVGNGSAVAKASDKPAVDVQEPTTTP